MKIVWKNRENVLFLKVPQTSSFGLLKTEQVTNQFKDFGSYAIQKISPLHLLTRYLKKHHLK